YRGFKYGEKVVAGDVAVTVTEVALTDAVPGQDRDPAHDYLDVRATLRWNGDRGVNAVGVAGALLGGALPTDHPDETARAGVLDADRNRLRTINPGMDYEVILYWPIRKGQQVIAVLLSVIEQIARDQDSRHAVTHSPREGDAVRVDLFKFKDLR
ncbi:MAG: hypothetical protein ACRDMV_14060, partial [Streptosporangiales bacterium]